MKTPADVTVTLFDLDGVLIRPGGYRAAVKATVNYFAHCMGLGDLAPEENELAFFEAHGVTSEWDMVPICLAFLLERINSSVLGGLPDVPLLEVLPWIQAQGLRASSDYRADFSRMIPYLNPKIPAAQALLDAIQAGRLFPDAKNAIYMRELLGSTRQLPKSVTMQVFQNFILGDQGFQNAYGFSAGFETSSTLQTFDQSLLSTENRAWLKNLISQRLILPAVITARPSLSPDGVEDGQNAYSPEAEMALDLTGLGKIPLVGFGSLQFLASRMGVMTESLLKPSPVHALAGIAVALGAGVQESLDWAAAWNGTGRPADGRLQLPARLRLHIFEDSPIGIQACQKAVVLLHESGIDAALSIWGVAENPDKISALQSLGARIFPDVNQAVQAAFRGLVDS